jgi:cytochrome c-type biogenesis protein CcmF
MNSFTFIGSQLISLALPMALFSCLIYIIGSVRNKNQLIVAGQRATLATCILITSAVITLVSAFLTNNFGIEYVAHYSSISLPFFYKVTGLWAGLDGSILFWAWLLSIYATIVLYQHRNKNSDWMPYINAVIMIVLIFFLSIIIFATNPFTPLDRVITDGNGLNPLLQNVAMVIHPPTLYLGFTGFTVPFAFVIAALITRRLDSSWIDATRRWTLISWFFLTMGLILGGAWAYVELGWGGFWAWDPVENAALLPFLLATAYLHSVLIQQKRGMLKVWNIVLVITTFLLTIFGTYLTRSGIVQSVHAFSETELGTPFLIFMGCVILVSSYLVITRLSHLRNDHSISSFLSKESAFLWNNVILLVATFAVLWGTMFPTMSELFTGQRITVGQPFFNRIMAPIGLILIFLMGVGPMISWKKTDIKNIRSNLLLPFIAGIIIAITTYYMGISHWYVVASAGLIAFVFGTLFIEFYRGIRVNCKQKNQSILAATQDLLVFSNKRYGGYIIHLGILLIFIAIAGTVYQTETNFSLTPGQHFKFQNYEFTYNKASYHKDTHHSQTTASVTLSKNKTKLIELKPSRNYYFASKQPTTEVDIYQTFFEDVYIILGGIDKDSKQADFKVIINPLISFMWLGGIVLLLGVIIVLMPRGWGMIKNSNKSLVILVCLFQFGLLMPHIAIASASQLQKLPEVGAKLICQCGGCVRESVKDCACGFAKKERGLISDMLKKNKTEDEIITFFINKYGIKVLASPPEKGFFNLGYWAPLAALFCGFLFAVFVLFKWRRKAEQNKTASTLNNQEDSLIDTDLAEELEKELKDL